MFNDIYKEIDKIMAEKQVPPGATPMPTQQPQTFIGTVMSVPGTEHVVLSTTVADFMTCQQIGTSVKAKQRYCVVIKNNKPKYNGQYINSAGDATYIVPKEVFDTVTSILNNANKQIQELKRSLSNATIERDAARMTIDALRKNGVID